MHFAQRRDRIELIRYESLPGVSDVDPSSKDNLTSAGVSDTASDEASRLAAELAKFLATVPSQQKTAVFEFILAESVRQTHELDDAVRSPIDPRILEWSRQQFDPQQAAANIREIRETGVIVSPNLSGSSKS
jgi:hypothetical protein